MGARGQNRCSSLFVCCLTTLGCLLFFIPHFTNSSAAYKFSSSHSSSGSPRHHQRFFLSRQQRRIDDGVMNANEVTNFDRNFVNNFENGKVADNFVNMDPDNFEAADFQSDNPTIRVMREEAAKCEGALKLTMMSCLTKALSEYAMNLAPILADLENLKCEAHNSISDCWAEEKASPCTMEDAKRASEALSDILSHRNINSTFLYGVLALDPICDAKKTNSLVAEHYDCLHKFHEGKKMLKEVDEVHVQIAAGGDKAAQCQKLIDAGKKIKEAVKTHCQAEPAGQLMCKAVSTPFTTLHPDLFDSCDPCPEEVKMTEATKTEAEQAASQNGEKAGTKAAWTVLPTTFLLVATTLAAAVMALVSV